MTHVRQSVDNKFTDDKFDAALNSINAKPISDEEILDTEYEVIEKTNPNDKRKKAAKILSGIAIGAGLVGGTLAYMLKGDKNKTVEQPTTTTGETINSNTNSINESGESTDNSQEASTPLINNFEISAELTNEQISQKIVENLNIVLTQCMNQDTVDAYNKAEKADVTIDREKWIENYVTPYVDAYFADLCGDDFKSNPNVKSFYDLTLSLTVGKTESYMITVSANIPKVGVEKINMPLYTSNMTYDSCIKTGNKSIIDVTETDNFWDTFLALNTSKTPETSPPTVHEILTVSFNGTQIGDDGLKCILIDSITIEEKK